MNILHVAHLYYPSLGGNQLHVQLMSEQLARLHEKVTVFTANANDSSEYFKPPATRFPENEMINGVNVRRFPVKYQLPELLKKFFKIKGAYRLFEYLSHNAPAYLENGPAVFDMLPAIGKLRPDIVTAVNNYYFSTHLCCVAKKKYNFKFAFMPIIHPIEPWNVHPSLKIVFNAADLVLASTDFERTYLIEQGVASQKITVLPLGVMPETFQNADGSKIKNRYHFGQGPVVAYIGRKVPHKGIETLIDAMRLVWKEIPDAQLLLAGHKEDFFAPALNAKLDQYTPEEMKRVINIDDFSAAEKKDMFAAIDILAMPSNIDSFGLVYLEAWACGKPVIACRHTAQEGVITHGHDGLLVDYQNVTQLAEAISHILKNPSLKEKMGNNGLQVVQQKFNVNNYGGGLREAYRQLLKAKKRQTDPKSH